ncbi:MAG: hypothetical protein U9R16_09360 [Campylobacterota bacterium]|nr:hypothetical protein [Campylobacterota bacterium]
MKEIVALEELIKSEESRIKLLKRQLSEHESGTNKLTIMAKASTESSLEENNKNLESHRAKLNELLSKNLKELEKEEKLKDAVDRKNYYHYQKIRLKRDKVSSNDVKLEAMMIIDELPDGVEFEDNILLDIAVKTMELNLRLHEELEDDLSKIRQEFDDLLKDVKDEQLGDIGLLKYQIPILVLHFKVLIANIEENIEEEGLPEFSGFPKYEDWWISEMWKSHQAYIGLYKWKSIVKNLCITHDQKRAWEVIFANWFFTKKMISGKGQLCNEFNYAFDTLLRNNTGVEEELSTVVLETMKKIIIDVTTKEDFSMVRKKHNIITPYVKYKREKIGYIDIKSGE